VTVWKNRVKSLTMEVPSDLLANPMNARRHPGAQRDAIRGSLDELGWAAPVIVNDVTEHVLDGHLRIEEAITEGAPVIPVVHVELTEAQERLFLAVYDPITGLAVNDQERLDDLIASIHTDDQALNDLLASLSGTDIDGAPIHSPPPKNNRTLVLIYDDEDDFSELVGGLSLLPGGSPADKVLRLVRNTIG
jgi:hypothetical protein